MARTPLPLGTKLGVVALIVLAVATGSVSVVIALTADPRSGPSDPTPPAVTRSPSTPTPSRRLADQ